MNLKYEDLELYVEKTLDMIDRQEFMMKVNRNQKKVQFLLEGSKPDIDEPAQWRLSIPGTKLVKEIVSMRNEDLYRDIVEMMELC